MVITALGSPGIRINVAVTSPPLTPPTYMPISRMTALVLVIVYVKGRVRASSMPAVIPGSTPTAMPSSTPALSTRKGSGVSRFRKASTRVIADRP